MGSESSARVTTLALDSDPIPSWFNLVLFATIDGRTEDAIAHATEWLENGDSFHLLPADPVLQVWADRSEYQEILAGNADQVKRQQQLYLDGTVARNTGQSTHVTGGQP